MITTLVLTCALGQTCRPGTACYQAPSRPTYAAQRPTHYAVTLAPTYILAPRPTCANGACQPATRPRKAFQLFRVFKGCH